MTTPTEPYWERVRELFLACTSANGEERQAILDAVEDPAMRAEVISLLVEHDATGEFLDRSIWELARDAETLRDPVSIGPFRVVQRLGEGGMGTVFLCSRNDTQYEQLVAIKLVRDAAGSGLIRRFRQERQILAALTHPNIAHLLDGGTTENGLPYLVMEYVDGIPIDVYCQQHALAAPARLRLFLDLCDAVQYAHRNLVIHRDLKPGNVLVAPDGVVKLLDFGIARLTSADARPDATVTAMMTPDYASPEQLDGSHVTTASDVYSLGILLFQLLTGAKPFTGVTRGDPPRASAVSRIRTLRGDLDRILAVALERDPERRFGSVENFAADIRRHLDGHPVSARGASLGYRTMRFVQRNRLFVVAVVAAVAVFIGSFFAVVKQKRIAERRFEQVRSLAHSVVFDLHDAIVPLRGSTAARQLLVQRALVYLDALAKDSQDNASLEMELAGAYQRVGDVQGMPYRPNLGDGTGALASYRKAQSLAERVSARDEGRRDAQVLLADLHDRAGLIEQRALRFDLALADHGRARTIRDALPDPTVEDELARARTWVAIADCLYLSGALHPVTYGNTTVQGAYENALAIAERVPPRGPHRRALLAELGRAHQRLGGFFTGTIVHDPRRAMEHHQAALVALEERVRLDPSDSVAGRNYADHLVMMATLQNSLGDGAAALSGTTQALATFRELASADTNNAEAQHDLAFAYEQLGSANGNLRRWKACDEALAEAMRIRQQLVAADPANFEDLRGIAGLYGLMAAWAEVRNQPVQAAEFERQRELIVVRLKR